MIYYNYTYKLPKYSRRLNKAIRDIYLTSISCTPKREKGAIDCFVYNVIRMVTFDYEGCYIILGNNTVVPDPIINGVRVGDKPSQRNTVRLLNTLEEEGYINIFRGYFVNSQTRETSYFCLTDKLTDLVNKLVDLDKVKMVIEEDVVVLKDSEKNKMEYTKSIHTNIMINQIKEFNEALLTHTICYRGKETKVSFKRVFNDGDTEWAFQLGGRYYSTGSESVQTISSNDRRHITIDGETCVEIDYSFLHISLCYTLAGHVFLDGFDPYGVNLGPSGYIYPDTVDEFTDRYGIHEGYNPVRSLIKTASLIMINADTSRAAIGALRDKYLKDKKKEGTVDEASRKFVGLAEERLDFKDIIKRVGDHNWPIKEYFNSGCGKALQYKDSLVMSGIISDFLSVGKVCIPVHDSAIVKKSDQALLTQSMIENYKSVMGCTGANCSVSVKW